MVKNNLLSDLLQQQQSQSTTSKQKFTLNAMYLGAPSKVHYPKLKDENGKNLKDSDGNSMVSEVSDGDTYTFSEIGTSKVLKVVHIPGLLLVPGGVYELKGLGYDMRSSNMIFIDEDTSIDEILEV